MRDSGALGGYCARWHRKSWALPMAGLGHSWWRSFQKVRSNSCFQWDVLRVRHPRWRRFSGSIFSVTCVLLPYSFLCGFLERADVPESWTPPHFYFRSRCPPGFLDLKSSAGLGRHMNLVSTDSLWDQGQVTLPRVSRFPDPSALRVGGEH